MTANIDDEFVTVDLVAGSDAATSGVDAFALSVIKTERQIRRLFTHTVSQFPQFTEREVPALRQAMAVNKAVYLDGLIAGIDHIWPSSLSEIIGLRYAVLLACVEDAIAVRNNIFHGHGCLSLRSAISGATPPALIRTAPAVRPSAPGTPGARWVAVDQDRARLVRWDVH